MREVLFGYCFTRFQVLVLLFLAVSAMCILCWGLGKRWKSHLEQKLAASRQETDNWQHKAVALEKQLEHCDPERVKALHEQLQSFFGHEIAHPLANIKQWGSLSLEEIKDGQDALRRLQRKIVNQASRRLQRAINIQEAFEPEKPVPKQLLDMRLFIEVMLRDDFLSFATVNDVILLTTLADVDTTLLSEGLISTTLGNVIHNAIKYSRAGGVVEIDLTAKAGVLERAKKALCIDVKNRGDPIPEDLHDRIFDLWDRGTGPIKPGQGLGLYLARRAANRQEGDLILVHSNQDQGTLFRILLPYGGD